MATDVEQVAANVQSVAPIVRDFRLDRAGTSVGTIPGT